MAKQNKPNAVEQAKKNLTEVQNAIESLSQELDQLQQEHDQISEQIEAGSLVADVDRQAELAELIGRRSKRLEDLRGRVLVVAEHALTQAELDALAEDQADGIKAQHDKYATESEKARQKIAEGFAELEAAHKAWTEYSSPVLARATTAGLTEGKADPLARVLVAGKGQSAHLVVDGQPFKVAPATTTLADAASSASPYLADVIARGREAKRWGLTVAQIGA